MDFAAMIASATTEIETALTAGAPGVVGIIGTLVALGVVISLLKKAKSA